MDNPTTANQEQLKNNYYSFDRKVLSDSKKIPNATLLAPKTAMRVMCCTAVRSECFLGYCVSSDEVHWLQEKTSSTV